MPTFLLMGDQKYFHTIEQSIKQLSKIYPSSKVFLYDWGIEESYLLKIKKNENVKIVDWKAPINTIKQASNSHVDKLYKKIYARRISNPLKKFFFSNCMQSFLPKKIKKTIAKIAFVENMLLCKIDCMIDCSKKSGEQKIIFLDADALLVANTDEVINDNFDVAVTLRRRNEISNVYGYCMVLNSGVIFFGSNKSRREMFLYAWRKKAHETKEYLMEQTGLTRLIEEHEPNLFDYYKEGSLLIKNKKINIKILPAEVYNFNWIEEIVADRKKINDIKILHFKGSRHNKKTFLKLLESIGIRNE